MLVTLYKNTSDNRTLNKVLTNATQIEISIKDGAADLTHFTILLELPNIDNYNYCYIPEFHRYYYINKPTVYTNELQEYNFDVDVLMSFKSDILKQKLFLNKSNSIYEHYINNGSYKIKCYPRITTTRFPSDYKLYNNNSITLATVGGVS